MNYVLTITHLIFLYYYTSFTRKNPLSVKQLLYQNEIKFVYL